jgi:hypothetical protein
LSIVLTIAVMVAAIYLGPIAAVAMGYAEAGSAAAMATAGIALAGSVLINTVIPAPKSSVPSLNWGGSGSAPAASPTYSLQGQGGEVIGHQDDVLALSEPVEWTAGTTHYLALRRRDGGLAGPYRVEAVPGDPTLVRALDPLAVTPYTGGSEERTYFSFGPGKAWAQSARVLAIRPRAEQVEITAVAEDARVHIN